MSHSHPAGLLAAYNSLTDKHLAGYFNNTRIRQHLLKSGLITRSGRILSEKEYKLNIMKRDHQKYIRECLAQAIFHKVLDMERYHQLEIKKKLETLARKERIQRFKGEHTRRSIENNMPILSPRPPAGPKTSRGHSVLVDEGHSSPLTLTAPRPYTAPGNMQPPMRLQPLPSNPAVGTVPKITSRFRSKTSLLDNEAPFPIGSKKAVLKFRTYMENSKRMNPYQLPNINSYMMPIPPPPPPPNEKITRESRSETWRRRFRPTTAPNGLEPLFTRDSRRIHKTSLHSNAAITMIYLGKNVHLSYDDPDFRDEIKVYQQHCGGENLCVYKGNLLEKETFQFISKRHHGFPFSLTFFLNGMQVNRLSSCCEYKHRKGSRLGGKRGYFGFVCVERSSPCYKCIIAMGLDKRTSSPKPRKEKSTEKREEVKKGEGKLRNDRKHLIPRRNETKENRVSAIFSAKEIKTRVREVRTAVEEMECKGKPGQDVWEDDQEHAFKYEYEEDFEVVEEKQDEKANEKGKADDKMNGISKSPSDDETDHLDPEKDSETLSQKATDADDNVKDEDDRCSESELEDDKQDIKTASSASTRSHPYSSGSEEEPAVGDREAPDENSTDESPRSLSSEELRANDEPGKSRLATVESFKTEREEQEITKADVDPKPLPAEESFENVLTEETEKGTQGITDSLSEKSRKHVSEEEKEKDKSKLWEGSTAKVKDEKAGVPGVEKGVGQIITEALAPSCLCYYDTERGVSSADERGKSLRNPEIDTGGASNGNLEVEERAGLTSNKESKQVAQETYPVGKKEAAEEDEAPQRGDGDPIEEKGDTALWGKAGDIEIPLGEWKPRVEQSVLVEQFREKRVIPPGIARGAAAEAEGDGSLGQEGLEPAGKAASDSEGLKDDEAPDERALTRIGLRTEKAASEWGQGSEKAVLASKAAALHSEHLWEAAALREAVTPGNGEAGSGAAGSAAGATQPDMDGRGQEAATDLEDRGPVEDAASQTEGGSGEAMVGGEKPSRERKEVMGTETPWSSSTGETGAARAGESEGRPEELREEDAQGEERVAEADPNRERERREMSPEESDGARERRRAERPEAPLRETEPEREEATKADAPKDEDVLEEEQTLKGEEGETVKEGRSEEETKAPHSEIGSGAEDEAPAEASELTEDTGFPENSLTERGVSMFEARPGSEESLENLTTLRKDGEGERLIAARDTEHRGRAELLAREDVAPSEQELGPPHHGGGASGAPASQPAGKAQTPEVTTTATGEAEDPDCLAELQGGEEEGPLQGQEGAGVKLMIQEDVPEGDPMMAGKFNEGGMDKDPEKEEDEERALGTGEMKDRNTEGDGDTGGGAVMAEEGLQGGGKSDMAAEKREVWADSKTAEGQTVAEKASPSSDVAGEETWHREDELLGKAAAAERVVVEEIALSREEVPAVEEVTATSTPEAGVGAPGEHSDAERKVPQLGQDQEGGEMESTQCAGSAGGEAGTQSGDGGPGPGAAEEFRLSRESLQAAATPPAKPDFAGTQEKQEQMVQRQSEDADVSLNNRRA